MPNGSNRTEKQHYVPQVYLKGFAPQYVYQSREKNKNSKTKYGVFYYDLQERTQSKIAVPIKSVCFENDLYEVTGKSGEIVYDNRLENRFSRLESRYAELRTNIENKAFIKENLLYNRDTLPMGEFAIGTNTTAYVMAKTYDILYQLPILIVEKMGPHFAVGDTCYSHCEETEVHNPDGKEIVAKYNECSKEGEYFQCHTDITIPYEELDSICAITLGGDEILLIKDGKFVLSGTETLNEPLTEIG